MGQRFIELRDISFAECLPYIVRQKPWGMRNFIPSVPVGFGDMPYRKNYLVSAGDKAAGTELFQGLFAGSFL